MAKTLTLAGYEDLCQRASNAYVIPDGATEAQVEEQILWLIYTTLCDELGSDVGITADPATVQTAAYLGGIHEEMKPSKLPMAQINAIPRKYVNGRLGRADDAPLVSE